MFCVGLTGTIASGKSTVAGLFAQLSVSVLSADDIARQITAPNESAFSTIVTHFGQHILHADGTLNRHALRDVIFQHPSERLWLEQLLHPLIRERILNDIQHSTGLYCMIEIPLLKNRIDYPYLNRVLLIVSERAHQIQRIQNRDQQSEEQALAILNSQANEESYRALADDIILNNQALCDLQQKIMQLHTHYLTLANKHP